MSLCHWCRRGLKRVSWAGTLASSELCRRGCEGVETKDVEPWEVKAWGSRCGSGRVGVARACVSVGLVVVGVVVHLVPVGGVGPGHRRQRVGLDDAVTVLVGHILNVVLQALGGRPAGGTGDGVGGGRVERVKEGCSREELCLAEI